MGPNCDLESDRYEICGFEITWEPIPSPAWERLPARVRGRMPSLMQEICDADEAIVEEIRALIRRYPDVDVFQGWLCQALRAANRNEEARAVIEAAVRKRPDYLFGRLNLIEILIDEGDVETAARLFGINRLPKGLQPHRNLFHISEVRFCLYLAAKLFLMEGNEEAAVSYRDMLAKIEPEAEILKSIDRMFQPENARMLQLLGTMKKLIGNAENMEKKRSKKTHPRTSPGYENFELFSPEEVCGRPAV